LAEQPEYNRSERTWLTACLQDPSVLST